MTTAENNFFDSIRANLSEKTYYYPDMGLPFPQNQRFFAVDVDQVLNSEEDVSRDFADWVQAHQSQMQCHASVRIFKFTVSKKCRFRLVCAYLDRTDGSSVTAEDVMQVRNYIEHQYETGNCHYSPTKLYFYVMGSGSEFDVSCGVSTNPPLALCEYVRHNIWTHKVPKIACGPMTEEF